MGIFPCPCCTYVTCVDLILPWCDPPTANFCRWAAHLGTPCGLPEHSQVRGTCICQLDPTSMGRSEPQDSLCFPGDQTWNRPPWLTAFCAPWGNLPDPSSLPFPCSLQPPPGSLPSLPTAVQHRKCFITHMPLCTCHFPSPPPPQAGQSIAGCSAGLLGMETGEEGKQDCKRESNSTGRN